MDIIKKQGYHYLRHSYRKGNRVVTIERYLGNTIPADIERIKKELWHESKKELYLKLSRIKNAYAREWRTYPPSIKKDFLITTSINFTYDTNAIEGSPITREETEGIIKRKIAPNRPLADIQETINHSKTFLAMLHEKKDLTLSLLLNWHTALFEETKPDIAGRLREWNVRVGNYHCPDWQDVKKLMERFFDIYQESRKEDHPVELAARTHYRFFEIHPFGDGNGRIARLITNVILYRYGYPFIIIAYKDRKSYYKALRKANKKGEYEFVKYFIRRYVNAHRQYLREM